MNPHAASIRCRDGEGPFLPPIVQIQVKDSQLGLRNGFYFSDHWRGWADVDAEHHVGRDTLLFWPKLEDVDIHHSLDMVFEDVATPGGVTDLVRTVFWIVDFIYLIMSSQFRKLVAASLL